MLQNLKKFSKVSLKSHHMELNKPLKVGSTHEISHLKFFYLVLNYFLLYLNSSWSLSFPFLKLQTATNGNSFNYLKHLKYRLLTVVLYLWYDLINLADISEISKASWIVSKIIQLLILYFATHTEPKFYLGNRLLFNLFELVKHVLILFFSPIL